MGYGLGLDARYAYTGNYNNGPGVLRLDLSTHEGRELRTSQHPLEIAARGNYVFFSTCGAIYARPIEDGAETRLAEQYCPVELAANARGVLWADGKLHGGGSHVIRFRDDMNGGVREVAVLDAEVYGLAADDDYAFAIVDGALLRFAIIGDEAVRLADDATAFALTEERIFFATSNGEVRSRPR